MTASSTRRARRRLDRLIKQRIKSDGDNCTICRKPFTDNALTFYGVAFATIAVVGTCCAEKLNPTVGRGIYIANYKAQK